MKPVNEWIIASPITAEDEVSEGGILIAKKPGSEDIKKAKVTQISEDISYIMNKDEDQPRELPYKVGDTVVYYGKVGINFSIRGEKFLFLKYDGMLAVE
jgi:co-chaperonin GroES (HSP10)